MTETPITGSMSPVAGTPEADLVPPTNSHQFLTTHDAMDPPEKEEAALHYAFLRRSFALLFVLFAILFISYLVGFVAFFIGNSSIMKSISVLSQCKIVSSSVDLRSSKVCELGLRNCNSKHVFSPFERKKFRCSYEYYWASIFKVEYKDHSGRSRFAWAEAPSEALPLDCRPSFGAVWLTKDRFKVNGTYDCWYTFGISKVKIYHDNLFDCQANDPSTIEMLRRYSILSLKMLQSWFSSTERAKYWSWEVLAGIVTGVSTSLISVTIISLLQQMKSCLPLPRAARRGAIAVYTARVKRACFLLAYFSFAGWLAIHYGKKFGIQEF